LLPASIGRDVLEDRFGGACMLLWRDPWDGEIKETADINPCRLPNVSPSSKPSKSWDHRWVSLTYMSSASRCHVMAAMMCCSSAQTAMDCGEHIRVVS
jgi:hypothetical protein